MKKHSTAILLFAKSAKEEAKSKCFHPDGDFKRDVQIAAVLNEKILREIKKTNLPYFHFTEKHQIGDNFGERLANSFQKVFEKGYNNIIAIGNDCLDLSSTCILKATDSLYSNKLILGPTHDGGIYLIGINQSLFEKQTFEAFSWETSELFEELRNYFKAFKILRKRVDIDDAYDLVRCLGQLKVFGRFKVLLIRLIFGFKLNLSNFIVFLFGNNQRSSNSLRAPPYLLSV